MTIFLVRHAKAGSRSQFDGPDWLRPLIPPGQLQARGLIAQFKRAKFESIISSPYVRCMETVVPLAADHRLAVEPHDALAEGASIDEVMEVVEQHLHTGVVLCSHGDIIPMTLEHFATLGVEIGADPRCEKGSTWVIDGALNQASAVQYWSPPSEL
jgi:broad specificity phosphatase PhoE